MSKEAEIHLFILWEKSRWQQEKILADIRERFHIIRCFDISWTQEYVSANFTRFYGVNLPPHSEKEKECGTGAFLLVVVEDCSPSYELRMTSRGTELVNANMFDSKSKYREWTGGGHKVHGTNNVKETNHDLTLLLGKNINDFLLWNNDFPTETVHLNKDIEGAKGWNSLKDLFYVLNNSVDYVIMRGRTELLNNAFTDEHRDIDLLVNDYQNTKYIINGVSSCNPHRPHELIHVQGYDYYMDLWNTKDMYYDHRWIQDMLTTKINIDGYNFLSDENELFCLIYHCLLFKGFIAPDYEKVFHERCPKECDYAELLLEHLKSKRYFISRPTDASITLKISKPFDDYIKQNGIAIRVSEPLLYACEKNYSIVLERDNSFIKIGTSNLIDNEALFLHEIEATTYSQSIIRHEKWGKESLLETKRISGVDFKQFFSAYKHFRLCYVESFVVKCLEILRALSSKGIIHRDFIPQNLLIEEDGDKCKVRLIDFGWATFAKDIDEAPMPRFIGAGYYKEKDCSDFYAVGRYLAETFSGMPFVERVCAVLAEARYFDYLAQDRISAMLQAIEEIINAPKSIKDHLFFIRIGMKNVLRRGHGIHWRIRRKLRALIS